MTPIDINPIDLKTVQQILREKVPELEVRVFGSRASWTARETSDLDLVLMTKEPLDISRMAKLKESFSKSNLPFRVDIVDWADTSENFRKITEEKYSLIQQERYQETKIRSGWDEKKLGDVAELVMGQSPPSSTYNKISDGLPFFQGVKDFNYRHPLPRVFCSRPSRVAQSGDILFSVRAPIGRVNVADRKCAAGRGLAIIKSRIKSDARYLEFLLRHMEPSWDVIEGSGSVFGNATKRDLETLLLPWPHNKQKRDSISHILGTLDDKIELNNRINGTLEAIARALFKSWFVDFDPVRTKMESRWRKGESFPCMPACLHDLFPSQFVNSELGQIPDGWQVKTLSDVASMTKGRSYVSADLTDSSVALVTLKSFNRGGGYRSEGLKPYAGPYKTEQIVKPGEVIVSCTDVTQNAEVIGRSAMVRSNPRYSHLIASLDIMIIRPNNHYISNEFLYLLSSTPAFTNHAYSYTTGTTVLHLAKDAIPSFRFVLPSSEITFAFGEIAKDIFSRMFSLEKESYMLAESRNALLPKLISGELSVSNMINLGTTLE